MRKGSTGRWRKLLRVTQVPTHRSQFTPRESGSRLLVLNCFMKLLPKFPAKPVCLPSPSPSLGSCPAVCFLQWPKPLLGDGWYILNYSPKQGPRTPSKLGFTPSYHQTVLCCVTCFFLCCIQVLGGKKSDPQIK